MSDSIFNIAYFLPKSSFDETRGYAVAENDQNIMFDEFDQHRYITSPIRQRHRCYSQNGACLAIRLQRRPF